jgi:heme/copper-type cytochrome/quinol oxidase subunit 4
MALIGLGPDGPVLLVQRSRRGWWFAMQGMMALGTLQMFIHRSQFQHLHGNALGLALFEGVPGVLVLVWWTFWAIRAVWRVIARIFRK